MSVREQLWSPSWDTRISGWTRKFVRKNAWKVEQVEDYDDLMQDAYLVFIRVKAAYPRVVDPQHFVALYKVAMLNEFTNKARYKQKKGTALNNMVSLDIITDILGVNSNEGFLQTVLSQLPLAVKQALAVLNDPEKCKLLSRKGSGVKENLNIKLSRLAGLAQPADVIGHLREALST